jgi:DUF2075 family protein
MPYGWLGTIGQLKHSLLSGTFLREIATQFEANYFKPTETELKAWQCSIPAFVDVLAESDFDNLQIIIELQMPVGAERADVILLGGSSSDPRAVVIELKQWSSFSPVPATHEIDVPGIGLNQHPSIQALNYSGKLHFFNSRAHDYSLFAVAFLHNASHSDIVEITTGFASNWVKNAPLFGKSDIESLASFIRDQLLPVDLSQDENVIFTSAPYEQSNQLFVFLQQHARDIARGVALAIANVGMGLTGEQDRLKNEILLSAIERQNCDYIIQGGPGSGKTLLAVSLLLKAAERKISCILALRNNRLQAILRSIFDQAYPGASGMMMFFEPRQGQGIANFQGHVDVLICDEAQRMESRIMPQVLQKATVSAIFLDETQRLNPPEQGTIFAFTQASHSVGRKSYIRKLTASVRVPTTYSNWVETLLITPSNHSALNLSGQSWRNQYLFIVCNTIEDLIAHLAELGSTNDRIALVASFTESPGNINSVSSPDNLRIGYPLPSGLNLYRDTKINIPWLMSTSQYKQFWINRGSNNLNRVASIYGAQGFESDYVGVIWGRDMLYRNQGWSLGDPNVSYDTIDRLLTGRHGNHRWAPEAHELMANRYRIFLTRGIKGTLIFCEDEKTQIYFQGLI